MPASTRLDSWPRAILHIDGDGFFASVEQAIHPELKGRPVVTGIERGIVAAASYEAKAKGIKRGVPLWEVRKKCPECVCLPSDYETYSLFSKKMFEIVRQWTPVVEEYSIDECFADLTGLRRLNHANYRTIGGKIKEDVEKGLGISVSVGVSLTKSLSKLCSKFRKPSGLTAVPGYIIDELLRRTPLDKVWGFGPNITAYLNKLNMQTAYDFIQMAEDDVKRRLGKVGTDIWNELRGNMVHQLNPELKASYQSIGKSKTFTPSSKDRDYVLSQLLRNVESACIKARRYQLQAKKVVLFLRKQDFTSRYLEISLSRPTVATIEMCNVAREIFRTLFEEGTYRSTGVVLCDLTIERPIQFDLFSNPLRIIKIEEASKAIDAINEKFGKHTVSVGDGLLLKGRPRGKNDIKTTRQETILPYETKRQHLGIPMMFVNV